MIARTAKRDKGKIYFWDELGFCADAVHGKRWGLKGQPSIVSVFGQRQIIRAKGAPHARTSVGALTGPLFVDLLRGMLRGHWKLLHLIVEGISAQKVLAFKEYAGKHNGKLTVYYLPGYAPDLNPDEFGLEPCQANQ